MNLIERLHRFTALYVPGLPVEVIETSSEAADEIERLTVEMLKISNGNIAYQQENSRLEAENERLGRDLRDTTLVLEAHRQTKVDLEARIERLEGALRAKNSFIKIAFMDAYTTACNRMRAQDECCGTDMFGS